MEARVSYYLAPLRHSLNEHLYLYLFVFCDEIGGVVELDNLR